MRASLVAFCRVSAILATAVLAGCGGGGYGGDGGSTAPATLTLAVNPTTITLGQSATVTWTTNGASCTATGAWSGTKAASGSEMVAPADVGTFNYTLSCFGGGYGQSEVITVALTVNPASAFIRTVLVSSFAGTEALATDAKLASPRGIAVAPDATVRVVGTTLTEYDGRGKVQSAARKLARDIAGDTGIPSGPTGIVVNTTSAFVIDDRVNPGPAEFIYADKGGTIGAWSRGADSAVIVHAATDGAVYTGLALARNGQEAFLYATDFRNSKIDVFDASFRPQASSADSFAFDDPALPDGYAPFGIQAIEDGPRGRTRIYVTYARQLPPDDQVAAIGAGLGLVSVFDSSGRFLRQLVAPGGALNAPWGIALAPADFGPLANALLIGNSGDGTINAYDPESGAFIGTVSDADGRPIATERLWGIAFGNGGLNQPGNTLFFVAGMDDVHGSYGRIDVGGMPPPIDD